MISSGKYKLLLLTLCALIMPCDMNAYYNIYDNVNILLTEINKSDDLIDVIVLDPGHGGKDQGCHGHHLNEKDIALNIALQIGVIISREHPEITVRYTRIDDTFVPLHKRVQMANEEDVDLFISLHCNALNDASAHGIESYVMGLHTSKENMDIAKRENDVIDLEDNSAYGKDFDPYSAEGHIMIAMHQQNNLEKSIDLADFTQDAISHNTTFRNRGVKQAGFVVLRKVIVPSILIEAGFITNPSDAKNLKSRNVQEKIAASIVNGIEQYIAKYQDQ